MIYEELCQEAERRASSPEGTAALIHTLLTEIEDQNPEERLRMLLGWYILFKRQFAVFRRDNSALDSKAKQNTATLYLELTRILKSELQKVYGVLSLRYGVGYLQRLRQQYSTGRNYTSPLLRWHTSVDGDLYFLRKQASAAASQLNVAFNVDLDPPKIWKVRCVCGTEYYSRTYSYDERDCPTCRGAIL